MPIGSSWMDNTTPPREIIMESSRLSDSESDTEQRPSFADNSPMFNESPNDSFPNKRRRSESDEDEIDQPPTKKLDIGKRLMEKMGFTEGTGLGKYGQGRLQPVEAFNQKGRRGLGHDNVKLKEATLKWDPAMEVVSIQEDMLWLDTRQSVPTSNELNQWMVLGTSKETLDDETLFCDPQIVEQVVNSKSIFDTLDKVEMRRARTRSNPFETIRGAFFQNRAAVKMANLDKAADFIFTNPKALCGNEPLYFADVCAGPGGFSEYVLWRNKWHAKGFGFTLKESNDFKLDEFYAGSPETFHTYYGPKDDGNVYDPDNQDAFRSMIMHQTRGRGVHFMMADGGFSVEGKENIQEILSKQLYLCQCLVALMIVREGGHFVTKLFDLFTPFSAGLVYLMYRCFKRVSIFKPNTSRPANSERYLICQDKLANTEDVMNYLTLANHLLLEQNKSRDVMELVPLETLRSDEQFYQYLKESNESLGRKQVVGLLKIAAYCEDTGLFESRQAQMRKDCLQYWELPDQTRTAPRNARPEDRLQTIIGSAIHTLIKSEARELTVENMHETILSPPCDWYCVPCEYNKSSGVHNAPTFYFGMGRTIVFRLLRGAWERVVNIELPPDTLVYAELVTEYRGQHKTQRKTTALHIIDAWILGGEDISHKYLTERHALINKFCAALWKPHNSEFCRVRTKELHSLDDDLPNKLKMEPRILKNGTSVFGHYPGEARYSQNVNSNEEPYYYVPHSVMFIKSTNPPWTVFVSRHTRHHYFFHPETKQTAYSNRMPGDVIGTFLTSFESRIVWHWFTDRSMNIQQLSERIKMRCPLNSPPKFDD